MVLFACAGPAERAMMEKPDLVVSSFQTTSPLVVSPQEGVEVPVRVIVRNQGNAPAGIFKVGIEYTGPEGTSVVPFSVPDQTDLWYPLTKLPLAPGGEIVFDGNVVFHPLLRDRTVSMYATAESCVGDEAMPTYCRVDESNEFNNKSGPLSVALP